MEYMEALDCESAIKGAFLVIMHFIPKKKFFKINSHVLDMYDLGQNYKFEIACLLSRKQT